MTSITVALAQINPLVGDIPGNTRKTLDSIAAARAAGARVVLLPELMLTGYPPEDLLLRPSLDGRIARAVAEVAAASDGILAVVGYPRRRDGVLYNMAGVFRDGELVAEYAKQLLPNYQVFDEKRYFGQGTADRKSTRLNCSHVKSSYAVFCLKKKKRHVCLSCN